MAGKGANAVRAAILGAPPATPTATPPAPLPEYLANRFSMNEKGLWLKDPDGGAMWICAAFEVLAETRDDAGLDRGLWVGFHDREGGRHEMALPFTTLVGDGGDARGRLAYAGLRQNPHAKARQAFLEYLNAVTPTAFARCVPAIGWHQISGERVYVTPSRIYGTTTERIIFQPAERVPDHFTSAGTLAEWQAAVGALCPGNTRLLLAVSAAFAGPLLDIISEAGGGIHFKGASRLGKSTALKVAASVWGGPEFISGWRTTDNALEATAAGRSDSLLPLDEMGQCDPKTIGDSAYMLANGAGKVRARRDGLARPVTKFRVLFLSTGEAGLADMAAEANTKLRAGQEVRLVDVPADAGAGFGLFERLHEEPTALAFAQRLQAGTERTYGTAAPAFLEHLLSELRRDQAGTQGRIRARVEALSRAWLDGRGDVDGQVQSVSRRFALAAVAGEIATAAGITNWEAPLAADAARVCFEAWLAERGTVGAREDQQAVIQLRTYISRNQGQRFMDWIDVDKDAARQVQPEEPPKPSGAFRPAIVAGWRRWVQEADGTHSWRFFLTPDAMKEALVGLNFRDACRALITLGYLIPDKDGRSQRSVRPPGYKQARLCEVPSSILGADPGEA